MSPIPADQPMDWVFDLKIARLWLGQPSPDPAPFSGLPGRCLWNRSWLCGEPCENRGFTPGTSRQTKISADATWRRRHVVTAARTTVAQLECVLTGPRCGTRVGRLVRADHGLGGGGVIAASTPRFFAQGHLCCRSSVNPALHVPLCGKTTGGPTVATKITLRNPSAARSAGALGGVPAFPSTAVRPAA
jgi:hypothetical protein